MTRPGGEILPARGRVGALVTATSATVATSLPLFLVGALAVQLSDELDFGAAALGTAVGLAQAARALAALALGRVVDRLGASVSLRLSAATAAVAAMGIALGARSWITLVLWLMLSACAQAIGQPAVNRFMVNRIQPRRLGTAFGIKQAAPPGATMLAGLSVPVLAVTVGWRWAYVFAAVLATVVVLFIPRPQGGTGRDRQARRRAAAEPLRERPTVIVMAAGFGLSFAASAVVVTFYVDANVAAGGSADMGGLLLACASLAAILARILTGIACDRTRVQPLRLCAVMLGLGTGGHVLLSVGHPVVMAAGVIVALAGTWGFPSAFWLALMRAYPESPGRATGAMAPGVLGGVAGPIVFGVLVDTVSYQIAWTFGAVVSLAAAATMFLAAKRLRSMPAVPVTESDT